MTHKVNAALESVREDEASGYETDKAKREALALRVSNDLSTGGYHSTRCLACLIDAHMDLLDDDTLRILVALIEVNR